MPIEFSGSDPNIQRKVRRAYQLLKQMNPIFAVLIPNTLVVALFKAIYIANDEDLANYNTIKNPPPMTPQGAIEFNITDSSLLNPVPYDLDV